MLPGLLSTQTDRSSIGSNRPAPEAGFSFPTQDFDCTLGDIGSHVVVIFSDMTKRYHLELSNDFEINANS